MKKIFWTLLGAGVLALLYYVFIRPFEFEVNFKANTLPGDLIETIRIWDRSIENANIIEVDSLNSLKQTITWNNRNYIYDWHFNIVNDTVTKVNIRISEPGRSIPNKFLIPFSTQPIETDATEIAHKFYNILQEHLRITDVKILGKTILDSAFCVCRSLETNQIEKANGMMRDYSLLTTFIDVYKLSLDGKPSVRIQEWHHNQGKIKFDFCFPILETDSLPMNDSIHYKRFNSEAVLKAEYHGNYITSDRAWYELIQFADKNGIEPAGLPIEIFYNNPNLGLNESSWRAEIYLPIKD